MLKGKQCRHNRIERVQEYTAGYIVRGYTVDILLQPQLKVGFDMKMTLHPTTHPHTITHHKLIVSNI